MNKHNILVVFILLALSAMGQKVVDIESHIEKIISKGDEVNNSSYYDLLLYYHDNPINLNQANRADFFQLMLLEEHQINEIIAHRENNGEYISVYELQSLESMSIDVIRLITPFVIVPDQTNVFNSFRSIGNSNSNYISTTYSRVLQSAIGFTEGVYLGSPDKAQLRLRLRNPGKLSIGLTIEKDPGEPWSHNSSIKQPDYLTAHVYLENHGRLKQLALGDFKLQVGQGLVLGSGFMVGKNAETVTSVKQSTLGVLPYNSVTEANFFRGVALNLEVTKQINLTMFYSNQWLDATVNQDIHSSVSSIRTTGLHRTPSEIDAMNQLHEQVWGGLVYYTANHFSTGTLVISSQFNKPIIPAPRAYNHYRFSGKELTNISWFGQYRLDNFTVFGEIAKSVNAGLGITAGLIGQVSKYLGLSLSYRSLAKNFHSLYGQTFTERSTIGNESGIYWGIKIYPTNKFTISAYYDLYRFPWLTFNTAAPASGGDMLLRTEYKFSKLINGFLQLRFESAMSTEANLVTDQNIEQKIVKSIANINYSTSRELSFRTRIQYNLYNNIEKGWLLHQDFSYNGMKFGATGRILFFDTDSYASRQYVYEKDMLFSYFTRAYAGTGLSYYLILKFKPIRSVSIRAKISYTEYANQKYNGSGYNLIEGNNKTQITAQIHFKF